MPSQIAEQWRAIIDKSLMSPKGFGYILEHHPVNLDSVRPGFGAETELYFALEVAFAYPDHPMILAFAKRSFDLASQGLWNTEGLDVVSAECEDDRFSSRRCRSYTASMLGIADLDRRLLSGAAEDILLFMQGAMSESGWDGASQAECLQAATLFLLAGEIARMRELFSKRRFKWFKPWQQGLLELADVLESGRRVQVSEVPHFEALFQEFRPHAEPEFLRKEATIGHHILRLEICLMRYLYVTHPGEPIVWRRVFAQVGDDTV